MAANYCGVIAILLSLAASTIFPLSSVRKLSATVTVTVTPLGGFGLTAGRSTHAPLLIGVGSETRAPAMVVSCTHARPPMAGYVRARVPDDTEPANEFGVTVQGTDEDAPVAVNAQTTPCPVISDEVSVVPSVF